MKKIVICLSLVAWMCSTAFAQPGEGRLGDRIKAFRAQIFTEELSLTSEEAQAFWPIYNEFSDKREDIKAEFLAERDDLGNKSDAELEELIRLRFVKKQQELDNEKEMVAKLRKVLPLRKIVRIHKAEKRFRAAMLQKMKERRGN